MWPGLRREHDPEKSCVRNVARTEARTRSWKKKLFSETRSDSNPCGGTLQGPEVWPGLRREHDPEKPGARHVARTKARARFREAKSILTGKSYGFPMTARIQTLGVGPYRGPKYGQD